MLNLLNEKNEFKIYSIYDDIFKEYGNILKYDITEVTNIMDNIEVPGEKNIYVASDTNLEQTSFSNLIKDNVYGGLDIQVGYCNGNSSSLNALEYHCGSEVNIAITDLCLFLAKPSDIIEGKVDTSNVKAFYVPKGSVIELNQNIMHFAPCKVDDKGFKCIVVLLKGTNGELEISLNEETNLFKHNKWILVHPDRQDLIDLGAHEGIIGTNWEIKF